MADGIVTVLDALQFVHPATTSLIWSVNAAGIPGECVKTTPITLPFDASEARVIINNGYGATGSSIFYRVKLTKATAINPLTKTENTQVVDWTSLAISLVAQTAAIDLTGAFGATVHVDIAIIGTTAHLGTEVIVQVRKEATVSEWTDWARLVVLSGITAFSTALNAQSSASILTVAAIGNLTTAKGFKFIFVQDNTPASSEICYQISGA